MSDDRDLKVHVTVKALRRMTVPQWATVIALVQDSGGDLEVGTDDVSLGPGWVTFTMHGVFGGIASDGRAHT